MRDELLRIIEDERDQTIAFIRGFVKMKSPNPPGDTVAAMNHVREFLDKHGAGYDIIELDKTMPNLVASTEFEDGVKHLVLNGHIDVFPVENTREWNHDPWGADVSNGAIYGRGVADMKVGTSASILTYLYLRRLGAPLKGKLTLTVVSDEETFGPYGARYLFEACPERITGTACLNGEPSSHYTVRFGEKGAVWLRFTITTPGGHGAFHHLSPNAIELAYPLINDLREFTKFQFQEPPEVVEALEAAREQMDKANGAGAARIARSITMNVGTMVAGPKVNMIASKCQFEVDFRLPNGVTKDDLLAHVEDLRKAHDFSYEVMMSNDPNWCEPESELAQIVRRNAERLTGVTPVNVLALGNTDARLWRYRGVPAVVYGPAPRGMGSFDEHVPIEEMFNVVRCHALSAYDYLSS
ncbi:MAG TPA: M20/M25/M40 family metallo-hydrolase [Sphingomicrobium sp.]|nr:M20/M25/M40 family metallo-hydrolase [Sphingomicrobium sp.]